MKLQARHQQTNKLLCWQGRQVRFLLLDALPSPALLLWRPPGNMLLLQLLRMTALSFLLGGTLRAEPVLARVLYDVI